MNLPPELYGALLDRRVIFLRGQLDDAAANNAIGQLVLVSRTSAGQPIELYLDSPGGSLSAALTIFDVLRTLEAPVAVTCLGTAGGASVLVLAGGSAGRRFALPHARIHLTAEAQDLRAARPADLGRAADEATRLQTRWLTVLAEHTAHSATHIARDVSEGRWLSAAEARDYGLVDGIVPGVPR